MTAPEPHDPPTGRLGAPGRRGVARGATLPGPPSGDAESPLRRVLRATATQSPPAATPVSAPATPARWRRPERRPEMVEVVPPPVVESAGPDATAPVPAPVDEVPPILRAMLAARASVQVSDAAVEDAAGVPDAQLAPDAGDSAPVPDAEDAALVPDVEASAPTPDADPLPNVEDPAPVLDAVPTSRAAAEIPEIHAAEADPAVAAAALTEALPFARLAAVACADGEPEPPLCHPAAAIVSRLRPLSPLRAPVRHGRRRRRLPFAIAAAAASVLVVAATTIATAALATAPAEPAPVAAPAETLSVTLAQDPPPIVSLDDPATAVVAAVAVCDIPAVQTALAAADASTAIAAAGGARPFHDAVVTGAAPCVTLGDPTFPWVVVNKQRPNAPVDYQPASIVLSDGVASLAGGGLRPDAAAALSALVAASRAAGAGDMAVESAFRSYDTQTATHDEQIATDGVERTDATSARPGFSEHQTGLAADLVACDGGCGALDDFGASTQGQWVAANAWQFGWIVRYESGTAATTGYEPEPWHLRYVGPELAALYHDGGFHTLEEFWALPAAPTY